MQKTRLRAPQPGRAFQAVDKLFEKTMAEELTQDLILDALKQVKYPGFSRDIVSFGLVKDIEITGNDVHITLRVTTKDEEIPDKLQQAAGEALSQLPGAGEIKISIQLQTPERSTEGPANLKAAPIDGVKHIIAVASGKGGVGKSTVAANLAAGLQSHGARVGLLDCDLYGPSIGLMFGTRERPSATEQNEIIPIERYGIKLMSMGLLLEDTSPVILRGPIVTRYTQQFLRQVAWGELDYLVLDLPPGTGDIQLTIVQTVALDGAVIVTTPQEVALIDARKATSMFAKVNVPVLGIIENMSYFLCPNDGNRYHIFGQGGGEREARRLKTELLGEVPIDIATREAGDRGKPQALKEPDSEPGRIFQAVAAKLMEKCADN